MNNDNELVNKENIENIEKEENTPETKEVNENEQIQIENTESKTDKSETLEKKILIDIKNLSVEIQEKLILSHVNFTLKQGEMAYIIGKTGSGKSTFLKTIYAEVKPIEGEIHVCDFNLRKIKQKHVHKLRKRLGMVFQDFQLLTDRTVQDNLLFVLQATGWKNRVQMLERCKEVLSMVGLEHRSFSMPHQLSGGEQQRVCIARAMLNNPDIILADEPTGNLDPETADSVMATLKQMNEKGIAILMVTHNYNLIHNYPAKTYQCREGIIEEILSEEEISQIFAE